MEKQMLIALGREYGSGGREIAQKLAKRLDLPLYNRNMLEKIAEKYEAELEDLEQYDESPRKLVFSRRVNGFSNAPEDSVAQMEFNYIRDMAKKGGSFIVLGRCAEEILKDYPGLVRIFIRAGEDFRVQRVIGYGAASEQDALVRMLRTDRRRKLYHDQFCTHKWGEAETYDLIVDSSRLGIDKTVDLLEQYIAMCAGTLA